MGSQIGVKKRQEANVYDAALERINDIYDRADQVTVGFSGGKDSTACLNLTLQVARERGRLPLVVHFFDEEAIIPTTVEYMERVRANPDIDLKWWCIPIQHRNGCSRSEPFWYPWDPKDKHLWVRDLPEGALTELKGFIKSYDADTHTGIPKINHLIADPADGLTVHIVGLRADESMRRFQSVARSTKDNYYSQYSMPKFDEHGEPVRVKSSMNRTDMARQPCPWVLLAQPIYDWSDKDVWRVVRKEGWDYNVGYDIYRMMGIASGKQRICPPFGEEPMQALWTFQQAWPELWGRMTSRVDGAATAARYSRTELYSYGRNPVRNMRVFPTPMSFILYLIKKFPSKEQKKIAGSIRWLLNYHNRETNFTPLKEAEEHPRSGISWDVLYMMALRGDIKQRKFNQIVTAVRNTHGSKVRTPRKGSTLLKQPT